MEDQNSKQKQMNCWNTTNIQELIKTLTVLIEGQKQFGKEYSLKSTLDYYLMKLEKKFSVAQVLHALDIYTDMQNDIPAPSDIINILNPQEPRITEAQFVTANKYQEINGWPMFSDAQETIDRYRHQEKQGREKWKNESDRIADMKNTGFKQIGGES